jgi:glyoxylase-like metal-dependent hydrolase (beta-lactamase superfamily II)
MMIRAESTREVAPLVRSATAQPRKRPWARNPFATARLPTEVLPGITLLGSRRINFYALTEGRSVTLVDCGFYGHLRYLEAWLERTGRKLTDIEAVVITHGHADHLGFASIFEALAFRSSFPSPIWRSLALPERAFLRYACGGASGGPRAFVSCSQPRWTVSSLSRPFAQPSAIRRRLAKHWPRLTSPAPA